MEKTKAGLRAFSTLDSRVKAVLATVVVLLIVMVIAFCISNSMRANIQREYAAARNEAGKALYSNLFMLMKTFDMAVPNSDVSVSDAILPQMKEYFIASVTLNSLLVEIYGQKYKVLTDSDINDINNAFAAYETAFRNNTSTDLAASNMRLCMDRIGDLLKTRFVEGELRPAR